MSNNENGQAADKPLYKQFWFWIVVSAIILICIEVAAFTLYGNRKVPAETQPTDDEIDTVAEGNGSDPAESGAAIPDETTSNEINETEPEIDDAEETTEQETEETSEPTKAATAKPVEPKPITGKTEETTEPKPEETSVPVEVTSKDLNELEPDFS